MTLRPARELAHRLRHCLPMSEFRGTGLPASCFAVNGDHSDDCEALTAAIEADRREVIEVCAKAAEHTAHTYPAGTMVAGCDHGACVGMRDAAARVRAIAKEKTP